MDECMGPGCSRLIDGDEPFCGRVCEQAFEVWAADVDAYLADHESHWTESEVAS